MPCSVTGCCEIVKHISGLLLCRETINDVLCQQSIMIYGRLPVSKTRLFRQE